MTALSFAVGFTYIFLLIQIIDSNNNLIPVLSDKSVSSGYGPFHLDYTYNAVCRGPKPVDVGTYGLVLNKVDNGSYIAVINFTVPVPARLTEVKLMINVLKGGVNKEVWSHKVSRPCQHVAIGFFFMEQFHLKRCIIEKGNYSVVSNFSDLTNKFFGGSFFYGEFFIKVYVTATTGNMFCAVFKTVFSKKTV